MNQVSLMGNVATDLELKASTKNSTPYTQFKLAVDDYYGQERKTNFIRIVAFGQKAETLTKYITKGRKLVVNGRMSIETYQDKDGIKRERTSVILEDFEFADYRDKIPYVQEA